MNSMEGAHTTQLQHHGLGSNTDRPRIKDFFKHVQDTMGMRFMILLKSWTETSHHLAILRARKSFLLKCRYNNVLPRHIIHTCKRFNLFTFQSKYCKKAMSNLNYLTSNRLLKFEIKDIHYMYKKLKNKLSMLMLDIQKMNFDKDSLDTFLELTRLKSDKIYQKKAKTLNEKLNSLLAEKQQSNKTYLTPKNNWIKNLSNVTLPQNVIDIVSLGHNFNTSHSKFEKSDIITTIKNVEFTLEHMDVDSSVKREIREFTARKLQSNFKKQEHISPEERDFARKLTETRCFLRSNKNIFFTHADKGNLTVCLEKDDYFQKMGHLLSDTKTYRSIKKNPIKKLQSDTYKILQQLNNNEFLHKKFHNIQLTQTDTILPKAYGLPKIHKPNIPLRPIISTVNSPTHFLSKIIYQELKNLFPPPKSRINNSFELKKQLDDIHIPPDHILLSLDVSSLFTNIPCEAVITGIERRIRYLRESRIPLDLILKCIRFIFDNTFFQFKEKYYQQIFGSPMGSPISPLFADLVMEDLENEALWQLKSKHNIIPIFYKRYVDDTLLCVKKSDIGTVLTIFNNINPHLQFTHEIEIDNSISFLDISLIRENNRIITNWFRKPTQSNRTLNFRSNHTMSLKRNIVYNLIDRAILLSDQRFHNENINLVKQTLLENNYDYNFAMKNIKKRLCSIFSRNNSSDIIDPQTFNQKRPISNVSIPYNSNFFPQIQRFLGKYNIRTLPLINKKLDSVIKLGKDKTKKFETTNVVYKISCNDCAATYIGETKRALSERIYEHKSKKNANSVVSIHQHKHKFDWENTVILDREPCYKKRLISEMLYINCDHNSINKKEDIQYLSNHYKTLYKNI